MEVEADEEVQQWAAAARVSHLLPKLSQGGFKEMVAVCLIDANDIALMGITKPGDIKLLLRAVQQAIKASGEPAPAPVWPNLAPSPLRPASARELHVLQERFEELAILQNKKLATLHDVINNIATKDRTDRSAPTSFAQRYDRLRKVIAEKPWFPVANEHPMLGRGRQAKRLFPVHGYPAAGADETRVVQPYWSDKLKNFPDKHLAVVLKDTHRSVSFGTRKPDVVGYLANKPRSIFHIALVGDVKARRQENKAVFDASEKGQMESFLEDLLLEFQPYRQAVNGFLTDGCLIQFFRLEKLEASTRSSACELQWTEGPVHFLHDEGDKWLLGLLRNRNAHGLPEDIVINEEPVVMDQLLGIGGSSVVYSGTHQGTQVVVKRFSSAGKLDHLQHEADILGKIKSMVPRVPRLIACDEQSLVLLLQPVGLQFASRVSHYTQPANKRRAMATADDFCQLVGILKTVHRDYQLVHRDVRLSNFFRDPKSGKVFLNDWGCATKVAESVPFSGALQHAPFHVLKSYEQKTTYTPQFSDDLEMVVRSVFHSLSTVTFEQIRLEQRVPKIISFWEHHLAPPTWSDMLAAARRADYAGLEMYIRNLLPGTPPEREGEDEDEGEGEGEGEDEDEGSE